MSPIVGTVDGADAAGEDGNGLRGASGQAGSTRIGHNAKDTMWPWNGITGGIRPPTAPRKPFPSSPAASAPSTVPTIGDMIDFQGHADPARRQGFDYDDVPYEA
jgi:tyrosinase